MRLNKDTSSLMNYAMATAPKPNTISVGDAATVLMWTDRDAGTVIEVEEGRIVVQCDHARRIDKSGPIERQSYSYSPDPTGRCFTFFPVSRGTQKGQWRENGSANGFGVVFGVRDQFHDYSF